MCTRQIVRCTEGSGSAGVGVDQDVGADRAGRRLDPGQVGGIVGEVEADAALTPDDQVDTAARETPGGGFARGEPGFHGVDDTRLGAAETQRPGCRGSGPQYRRAADGEGDDADRRQARDDPSAGRRAWDPDRGQCQPDGGQHEAEQPHSAERGERQHRPAVPLA